MASTRSIAGRTARVAAAALAACAAIAHADVPAPAPCATQLLQSLGWRIEPGVAFAVHAGVPCERASLEQAQAAGDLVITLPRSMPSLPAHEAQALLRDPATVCAYAFALGDATRRAVDRLAANPGYRFSAIQTGWIGFGASGARHDGWERLYSFGRGYRPSGRNSTAMDAFYAGHVRSECGVGRQVAQYAGQYELYGAAGFDAAFDADEIVIGTFNKLRRTRSVLLGSQAGDLLGDGLAKQASLRGRQAFAGRPGFVFHVFDRSYLDDIHNQAENFVVYDVSDAAVASLRTHGGLEYFNERSRQVWSLAATMRLKGYRLHERLLYDRDPALRATLTPQQRAVVAQIDVLLDDPFFAGFRVYVHRQGVKPIAFHLARLLDRNPRTPFRTELAVHNLHTTLFERYIDYRLRECAVGTTLAATVRP